MNEKIHCRSFFDVTQLLFDIPYIILASSRTKKQKQDGLLSKI